MTMVSPLRVTDRMPDDPSLTHGRSGYVRGCKCPTCADAQRLYDRGRVRLYDRVCARCGADFRGGAGAKYCTRACKDAMRRSDQPADRVAPVRPWADLAACAGLANVMLDGSRAAEAKRICGQCPMRDECREEAIEYAEWGIWGGTTDAERRRIRHSRRAAER